MPEDAPVPAAAPVKTVTFEDAMAAYAKVDKTLVDAVSVCANLEHPEASGLRGLFATTLATLRAGKPVV